MPKKIGAIGSDDDRKDIDFALKMANNPTYQQKTEQKENNQKEIKEIEKKQQLSQEQMAHLTEEQQRLQEIQNIDVKQATPENVSGSIYSEDTLNAKKQIIHDDNIKKINNDKEAEYLKDRLVMAKNEVPKIDGELHQKLSFAASDGTSVRDAVKVTDSVNNEIKKNEDIAQQYVTQAETLTSQYSNTSMVHEAKNDEQLSNQMKDSTKTAKPDANLENNKTENAKTDEKNKEELKQKEKFREYQ